MMAFSREEAFKRWIKKLKYRKEIFKNIGDSVHTENVDRRIKIEEKNHGV